MYKIFNFFGDNKKIITFVTFGKEERLKETFKTILIYRIENFFINYRFIMSNIIIIKLEYKFQYVI